MKTTNYLHKLLLAVVGLLTSVTASAQFTAKVDQVPNTTWTPVPATFSMSEVAAALGTDATSLLGAFKSWMAEGSTDTNMFFYAAPSAPDTWTDAYGTGGEKGFWIGSDAELIAYPNGCYYANPVCDEEAGTFNINIGMFPDSLKYGVYEKQLKFALKYNDKIATFTIDFTVTGTEKVDIPKPAALKEVDLNVVGEKVVTVEQYPRTSYDADDITVVLDDIVEKLGIAGGVLAGNLGELLYCTEFDTETVGKRDSVTNKSTAGAPGFWITDIRVNGEATGECSAAAYNEGDYFFAEAFTFNAETNELTFKLGQYPGKCKGDEHFFVNLYIIYGDKVYRIRLNFNTLIVEQGTGLESYTKVGEYTAEIEQDPTTDYSTKIVRPDMEAIAAALGCEVSDVRMKALNDTDNFAGSTGERGGFWFNGDGAVTNWNVGSVICFNPATEGDYSVIQVCQMPGVLTPGQEASATIYFFNGSEGDKYYAYTIHLTVTEPKVIEGDVVFNSVRTISFAVQTLVTNDHQCTENWSIDLSVLEKEIGTQEPILYALATDAAAAEADDPYTKEYTCTPYPGFWLDPDGRRSTYGTGAPVGFTYGSDGTFTFYQLPGANNVGNVFKAQAFLVNPETGAMITFNFSVTFVESIVQAEIVGEENITLPVSTKDNNISIDLSAVAEKLGVTVDDLMNEENKYLRGMTDSGIYGEAQNCFDGLGFGLDGYYDLVSGNTFVAIVEDGDGYVLNVYSNDNAARDFISTGKFCFQIDNKQYVFNVKFVSDEEYAEYVTGIGNVAAKTASSGKVYDLSGRQVTKPARGLYIVDGKKVVLK